MSCTKIKDKYSEYKLLVNMARDKERRAQWESGVWEDPWGVDLVNEVDAALATEEDIREERETATEGRQLLVQRQERQGQEVRTHKPNKW